MSEPSQMVYVSLSLTEKKFREVEDFCADGHIGETLRHGCTVVEFFNDQLEQRHPMGLEDTTGKQFLLKFRDRRYLDFTNSQSIDLLDGLAFDGTYTIKTVITPGFRKKLLWMKQFCIQDSWSDLLLVGYHLVRFLQELPDHYKNIVCYASGEEEHPCVRVPIKILKGRKIG